MPAATATRAVLALPVEGNVDPFLTPTEEARLMSKLSTAQETALRSIDRGGRFFADPRTTAVLVEYGYATAKAHTYGREGFITDEGVAEIERLDKLRRGER